MCLGSEPQFSGWNSCRSTWTYMSWTKALGREKAIFFPLCTKKNEGKQQRHSFLICRDALYLLIYVDSLCMRSSKRPNKGVFCGLFRVPIRKRYEFDFSKDFAVCLHTIVFQERQKMAFFRPRIFLHYVYFGVRGQVYDPIYWDCTPEACRILTKIEWLTSDGSTPSIFVIRYSFGMEQIEGCDREALVSWDWETKAIASLGYRS